VTEFSSMLANLSDRAIIRGRVLKRILAKAQDSDLLDQLLGDYLTIEAAQTAAQNYERKDVAQIETPTSGATVNVANNVSVLILNPAASLAALTVNLSDSPTRGDLCRIEVLSTRAITALTMAAGAATLRGPLTGISANGFGRWRWAASDTTWLRCG
jgi:hypothetical protein